MMVESLKKKYPFRLGTTSFIYPSDYVTNVRHLAPLVDEIELLLFESDHLPAPSEIEELKRLASDYGITYNVHLPMDVAFGNENAEIRQRSIISVVNAIERATPLHPTTYTLHLTFEDRDDRQETVDAWQSRTMQSMTRLLEMSGIPAGHISIETLEYSPFWFQPIVEALDLAVCVDVGHVILYGFDLPKVLDVYAGRTTMLHLHGVAAKRDHLSLWHMKPEDRLTLSRYLGDYHESASIEVFNLKRFKDSMRCFPDLMAFAPNIDESR